MTGLLPPGHWTILRFGYSLLGITNHRATPEATRLEVDKLDHRYVRDYMEKYLGSYKMTGGLASTAILPITGYIMWSKGSGEAKATACFREEAARIEGCRPPRAFPARAVRV